MLFVATETKTVSKHAEEFRACVADFQTKLAELEEIAERMGHNLVGMREDGVAREQLLAASVVLGRAHAALEAAGVKACGETPERVGSRAA
jgi:hypothetical protein